MHSLFGVYVLLSALLPAALGVGEGMKGAMDIQREQIERMRDFLGPVAGMPQSTKGPEKRQETCDAKGSTITFQNPAAQKFFVDGTKIPDGKSTVCHELKLSDSFPT